MSVSLAESQAVADLAESLYPFLPGKPHPRADPALSFPGVASTMHLGTYWPGGSKQPAITQLLQSILEQERSKFCPLIIRVVQKGIVYRKNKEPVSREEIDKINKIIRRIGFKIPELYDSNFLESLPSSKPKPDHKERKPDKKALQQLHGQLMKLDSLGAQERGYEFERFLKDLFSYCRLAPRGSFRNTGEQIDGSFETLGETYLLEAKWQKNPIGVADLHAFSGKVSSKAIWSRGLFVSYSGFSVEGLESFATGKQTNIICTDGLDLHHVLTGNLNFADLLTKKTRRAVETNRSFVPARELFPNVI